MITSIGSSSGAVLVGCSRVNEGGVPGSMAQQIVMPFKKKFKLIAADG